MGNFPTSSTYLHRTVSVFGHISDPYPGRWRRGPGFPDEKSTGGLAGAVAALNTSNGPRYTCSRSLVRPSPTLNGRDRRSLKVLRSVLHTAHCTPNLRGTA